MWTLKNPGGPGLAGPGFVSGGSMLLWSAGGGCERAMGRDHPLRFRAHRANAYTFVFDAAKGRWTANCR